MLVVVLVVVLIVVVERQRPTPFEHLVNPDHLAPPHPAPRMRPPIVDEEITFEPQEPSQVGFPRVTRV